jgi:hypothetical protein
VPFFLHIWPESGNVKETVAPEVVHPRDNTGPIA